MCVLLFGFVIERGSDYEPAKPTIGCSSYPCRITMTTIVGDFAPDGFAASLTPSERASCHAQEQSGRGDPWGFINGNEPDVALFNLCFRGKETKVIEPRFPY